MHSVTRLIRSIPAALLGAVLLLGAAGAARAQMNYGDPLSTAVPNDQRPEELRSAVDVTKRDSKSLRLYAALRKPSSCAPNKKKCVEKAGLAGLIHAGDVWENDKVVAVEFEKIWLLSKAGIWSSPDQPKLDASNKAIIADGPNWPALEPVDVIAKIKGADQLLQVRFQRPYLSR